MYKDILLSIAGIEVFPVVSLVLFVIVFTAVLISVARMDRSRIHGLAAIPLDEADRGTPRERTR
jgi:cytochrome c oxidase cbb3-type subunit IV